MMSKMEFDCKIAHLDEIKRISGFNSIKQLYDKISQVFAVSKSEILFCTLNTHNFRDMNSLLGNYLSVGDLIIVHLCGSRKEINVKKTQEYLGLTITDNGIGRAFVKKIRSSEEPIEESIKAGDHIAAINAESTVGMRHFEVAKVIREVPQKTNFILHLIEPLYSNKHLNDGRTGNLGFSTLSSKPGRALISALKSTPESNYNNPTIFNGSAFDQTCLESSNLDSSSLEYLTDSTLPFDKLLSKGTYSDHTIESNNSDSSSYRNTIEKINSILESFLGINDNTLAIQIYRLAKDNKDSYTCFTKAIKTSELSVFNFDEDIELYLWNCAIGRVI